MKHCVIACLQTHGQSTRNRQTHHLRAYTTLNYLVLKIVEFSAKVSDLRPEPGRLLLAVNGVHRAARRSRPKLLHLHSNKWSKYNST